MPTKSASKSGVGTDNVCSVGGCARKAKYKKQGWCQTHYHRWWRHGDPTFVKHERGEKGRRLWQSEETSYRAAHTRNHSLWGPARNYPCIECGESADEWAYDGTDPSELDEMIRDEWPVRYSAYPEFYAPLCFPCHRLHDRSLWSLRREFCKEGHELTPENTYTRPSRPSERACKECRKIEARNLKRRRLDEARIARGEEPKWKKNTA